MSHALQYLSEDNLGGQERHWSIYLLDGCLEVAAPGQINNQVSLSLALKDFM